MRRLRFPGGCSTDSSPAGSASPETFGSGWALRGFAGPRCEAGENERKFDEAMKRVLDVGNCDLDHGTLTRYLQQHFQVEVVRARLRDEALATLRQQPCDLVLVNRLLDEDGSEGLEVIRQIKADPQLARVPCMLISNFPESQQAAVAAGAEYGFGKKELDMPQTRQRLARFLDGAS